VSLSARGTVHGKDVFLEQGWVDAKNVFLTNLHAPVVSSHALLAVSPPPQPIETTQLAARSRLLSFASSSASVSSVVMPSSCDRIVERKLDLPRWSRSAVTQPCTLAASGAPSFWIESRRCISSFTTPFAPLIVVIFPNA
jgi:hypothetical protein